MRALRIVVPVTLALVFLASCASREASRSTGSSPYALPTAGATPAPESLLSEPAQGAWPQVVVTGATTNYIYQPQVDSWDGRQITARDAVAVQTAGQAQPTFGVVTLQALTLVDKPTKKVSLVQIHILGGDFPSARAKNAEYLRSVRESFPKDLPGLSLEQLENNFAAPPQQVNGSAEPLNNSPPRIIFSTKPAVLVYIDGPPAYRLVAGTTLERVVNSRALLLKDKTGQLFLHLYDGYMAAPRLEGPWTVAPPPEGAAQAETQALQAGTPPDLLEGRIDATNAPAHLTAAAAPLIYVSTKPAELIIFRGTPDFVPIPGTRLLYVENTTGNLLKSTGDQKYYVLLSGRWFRSASLEGPWQFVLPDHLPSDFADIPDNSPKENVKASVPGTEQATEALIANSVPQSTKVLLTTRMQKPQLDGAPQLRPIAGTPLSYVVNSGTPIIRVAPQSWYACQNGVWFTAASLDGPWSVAGSVPPVIYSIPPSSPLHYLTYVQVYGATPEEVYEGYTPGYLGTDVEDGVVVYGTGYYYPPWVGADWYGWPCTWGFGWGPCWTPWNDWCFDFGFGWGCGFGAFGWWGCHPFAPWWGPWRGFAGSAVAWRNSASTARDFYRRPGAPGARPGSFAASSGNSSVARPQIAGSLGRAYNSRTGALAAGQRAGVRNVYDGLGAQRGGLSGRGQFGAVTSGYRPASAQYGPYSRSAATRQASSFGRPDFYNRDFGGRSAGYYGGDYSHSYGGYGRGYGGYGHGYGGYGYGGGGGYSHGGGGGHSGGGGHGGGGGGHGGGGGGHGGGGR